MKKTHTLIILSLFAFTAQTSMAQLSKGSLTLGGTLSFSNSSSKTEIISPNNGLFTQEGPKNTAINLTPKVGYMLSNNWMIGAGVGFQSSTSRGNSSENSDIILTNKGQLFKVGPFVRYYSMPLAHAGIFVEAQTELGFGNITLEQSLNNQALALKNNLLQIDAGVTPGAIWFVTPSFAVEGSFGRLGFVHQQTKTKPGTQEEQQTESNQAFSLSFNPSTFRLGLIWSL